MMKEIDSKIVDLSVHHWREEVSDKKRGRYY